MHEHRHHRGRSRLDFQRPFPNRQDLLERLEGYQRDLEQEVADVADLIDHLRDKRAPQEAPAQ